MAIRVAVLCLLAAIVAACGGDGNGRLSKEELISQADAICRDSNEKIEGLQDEAPEADPTAANSSEETLDQTADFLSQAADIARDQVADLRDLEPPEADEARWDENLDRLDRAVEAIDDGVQAAKDRDRSALRNAINEVQKLGNESDAFAREYGFKVCGQR